VCTVYDEESNRVITPQVATVVFEVVE